MRTGAVLIGMLLFLSIFAFADVHADSIGGVHIEGPSVAATETTVKYHVHVDAQFDEYKCAMLVGGQNLTGGEPLNQVIKSSKTGDFEFEFKTPKIAQKLYINFKIYGITGKYIKIFQRTMTLDVVKPFPIKVEIMNVHSYPVYNVELRFYLDGIYIGNTTVSKVDAHSNKTVVYRWIPENVENGKHSLKVEIENPGITFGNGQSMYTRQIYYGTQPTYNYIFYLSIGLLIVLVILVTLMLLGRKSARAPTAPKWKK